MKRRGVIFTRSADPSRGLSLEAVKMLFAQANAKDIKSHRCRSSGSSSCYCGSGGPKQKQREKRATNHLVSVILLSVDTPSKKKYFVAMIEKIQRDDDGECYVLYCTLTAIANATSNRTASVLLFLLRLMHMSRQDSEEKSDSGKDPSSRS